METTKAIKPHEEIYADYGSDYSPCSYYKKKTSKIFLKEKDTFFVCFFLKRMVKKKQKGGYYTGEKRQRGGIYKGNKRQRGGNITEAAGKKLLNEIAKARGFFTNMVKKRFFKCE